MPEVVRGSRPSLDEHRLSSSGPRRNVHFGPESPPILEEESQPLSAIESSGSRTRQKSLDLKRSIERRPTLPPEERPEGEAYYDSRAATKREFKRRATTLAEYYKHNPALLPQLPFTWHHGWRRWKLGALIFLMFVDACAIPLVLYYALTFAGNVQGWIIFAIVATIWGGPTYLEFGVRSWRLIKKENFYRPLGTKNRWAFDFVHWLSTFTIASVTAFLVIGSAPHIVWLRILSLPGPALLLCLGSGIMFVTILAILKRPAPFRISSTGKGQTVLPGVLYIIEDVVAVNANAGRPYREAVHARYEASPRFRRMVMNQSLFWGIPSVLIGAALIVVICVHEVKKEIAYGLGWGIPFFWAAIWAVLSVYWAKRDLRLERVTWEMDNGINPEEKKFQVETPSTPEPASDSEAHLRANGASPQFSSPDFSRGRETEPKPDLESKRPEEASPGPVTGDLDSVPTNESKLSRETESERQRELQYDRVTQQQDTTLQAQS